MLARSLCVENKQLADYIIQVYYDHLCHKFYRHTIPSKPCDKHGEDYFFYNKSKYSSAEK